MYIAKEKKSNWHTILLNFWIIYETRTLSYGALKQCDMCYMGKSKKEKVIMIVVPVNPIGQRKRQDDVLSFQKITGSYYHFIAYLSLLNDRPNSFYHLNFNFSNFSNRGGNICLQYQILFFPKPGTVLNGLQSILLIY